jgi:hypothetical protein
MHNDSQHYHTHHQYGDNIEKLPSDETVPSHNEILIVDQFFQEKKGFVDLLLSKTTNTLILGILFVIFSLPYLDNLIIKFIPFAGTSIYTLLGIKTILFVISYFVFTNLYLSRKTK